MGLRFDFPKTAKNRSNIEKNRKKNAPRKKPQKSIPETGAPMHLNVWTYGFLSDNNKGRRDNNVEIYEKFLNKSLKKFIEYKR